MLRIVPLILSVLVFSSCEHFHKDREQPPGVARLVQLGPERGRADLFLHDDRIVASAEGVALVPSTVRKYQGNPVFVADQPYERGRLNYTCVIQDREEDVFKMWYQMLVPQTGSNLSWCHYAVSKDGIHWKRPNVGLIEFEGSKNNNILFEQVEGIRGTPSYWVLKDYAEPDAARRYKMMMQSWGFQGRSALVAYSPDGIRWTMPQYGNLPGPFDSQNAIEWDAPSGQYVGWFRSHRRGYRSLARATSPDGFHWSRPVTVHSVDERDPPTWHLYIPGAYRYTAARNTYVAHITGFDDTSHAMYPQLGVSRDGVDWYRFRQPFVPPGGEGEWDAGSTRGIGSEAVLDGQMAIFYSGSNIRAHEEGGKSGIGLAFLDHDALVGWHAAQSGTIVTHPLEIRRYQDRLNLIADAEGGAIRAELLNAGGDVIPGCSRDECVEISSNGYLLPIRWESHADLEEIFRAGPVRLKLYLEKATVYGIRALRPTEE